ncbi:MAG: EamA family transporter [Proteobacteria bacterium]|nr:EamA family transporter [Pseudomonadota bacterium]
MEISLPVMAAVLGSAVLHAGWNALLKSSPDKDLTNISLALARGVLALAAVPFLPLPAPAAWGWLAASVIVHIAYFWILAAAYRWGDLSFAYPVMRGGAPALVALAGVLVFGEVLPWAEASGVALICAGVLGFAIVRAHDPAAQRKALVFALLNAVVIATYTLIDARGVRVSGAPLAYVMWFFVCNSIVQSSIGFAVRGRAVLPHLCRFWPRVLVGGVFTLGAYGTALWAMAHAPVALVAALRETSVIFAALMGSLFLGERFTRQRLAATVTVLAGLVALRL